MKHGRSYRYKSRVFESRQYPSWILLSFSFFLPAEKIGSEETDAVDYYHKAVLDEAGNKP